MAVDFRLARIVPKRKHAPHRDIRLLTRVRVERLREFDQFDHGFVDYNRLSRRGIHRIGVVDAVIRVVNVEELVIIEHALVEKLHHLLAVSHIVVIGKFRHRIKCIVTDIFYFFELGLLRVRRRRACRKQETKKDA